MTSIIEEAEIINKYLCQIKKYLPLGIRLKKHELNDILDEIEEHIWEKAIESAVDKEPNDIDIQIAISQMGEPQDIASKFTTKSTPYVYINEELYPLYKKCHKTILWSLILLTVIEILFPNLMFPLISYQQSLELIFVVKLFNTLILYFTFFAVIGIIFCYLSITGYIPYELRQYSKPIQIKKPKFKTNFQNFVITLEISFFIFSAIFLLLWKDDYFTYMSIILFGVSIVKCLRQLKRKSVIWQKFLILLDLSLISWIILSIESTFYILYDYQLTFFYFSFFLYIFGFLYICYEVYTFLTFKDKLDLYLKELSLILRIKRKELILRSVKKYDNSNAQNIQLKEKTEENTSRNFENEFDEEVKLYLKKAKRMLPIWLKKEEKLELIKNIEEQIRDSILEFEESNALPHEKIQQYLTDYGNIKTILSEYMDRGTPKIFISKELWNWYLKASKAILTYFITILVFVILLQISFNASFTSFSIFTNILILWLLWILIQLLATKLYIYASINDIVPGINKSLGSKKNATLYYIWEAQTAVNYILTGLILIHPNIFRAYLTNLSAVTFILLIAGFILLLGILKLLKIVCRGKKIRLVSGLIFVSIVVSLVINLIILHNYHLEYRIIHSSIALGLFTYLFFQINIEIIYEIFHFFFQKRRRFKTD